MNIVASLTEPRSGSFRLSALVLVLGLGTVLLYMTLDPQRALASILTAAVFTLGLCLGGAIFVATQGAAAATWWHPIERVPLLLSRTLPIPPQPSLVRRRSDQRMVDQAAPHVGRPVRAAHEAAET